MIVADFRLTFFLTALLAFGVGWAATVTDVINASDLTATTTNYMDFSGVTKTSDAVYAGNSAKDGSNNIQLRSKNSTSGIVSTSSGGRLVSVKINVGSGSNTIDVYASNSAYTSASNLYSSSTQGTKIGSTSSTATITVSGDYAYVGIRSNNGAVYISSIEIVWETGGGQQSDPVIYRKVTSADELIAGTKSIIAYENGGTVVGFGSLNSSRYATGITGLTLSDNKTDIADKDVMEFTLGGNSSGWTLREGTQGYLRHLNSEELNFAFTTNNTPANTEKWTINVTNGTIQNKSSNSYVHYDTNNTYFYCRTSLSNNIRIFVKDLAAPEFSSNGGSFTGSTAVTITGESGSTIYYTTDGTAPTTSSNSINGSGSVTITESCTLKAIAVKDGASSTITSADFTITSGGGPSLSTLYRKVTSSNDLVDGQKYILVYEGTPAAFMGAISTTSTKYGLSITGPTISNDNKVDIANNSDIKVLTLTKDGNNLSFNNGAGFLCWKSGNSLNVESNITNNSKWTASGDANNGFILTNLVADGSDSRILKYNSTSGQERFACYKSGQQDAVLYVQEDSDAPMMQAPESLNIEDATGDATGTLSVEAQNLTDGIGVSTSSYWTALPNSLGTDGGNVTVEYTGRKLGTSGSVYLHTETNDVDDVTVPVDYLYTGDIYIVTKIPGTSWNFESGDHIIQMTPLSDGTYRAQLTAPDYGGHNVTGETESEYNHEFLQLTQRVGNGITWGSKYFFGPEAGSNWWLTEGSMNTIAYFEEANSHVIQMMPGEWTIIVNPRNNSIIISPTIADPVITLQSGRYYDAQTTTITCDTELAHIYYTTDGSEPSRTNGTLYDGNPIAINADMTLKAVAVLGSQNPTYSNVVTANYTIRALDGTDYVLANAVTPNDEYVLVYSSSTTDYAMGTFNSSNYYVTTTSNSDFELNGTIVTRKSDNVTILTIESAGNNQYYISDENGYLYFNSGNYVNRGQLDTDNAAYKWTITIGNDGVATIQNVGDDTRYLRCNPSGSSSRFACYQNSSTNAHNAKLYKRAITVPRLRVSETAIDLGTIEAGGTSVSKTFKVRGYNLTAGVTLNLDANGTAGFSVNPTTITANDLNNGYVTVTVTYTGSAATATNTVTITSDNNEVTPQTVNVTAARTPLAVTINPANGATFTGSTMSGTITANNANATIYYTTDGSDPRTSSTRQVYNANDGFTVTVPSLNGTVTVSAYAVITNGNYSEESAVATATYTRVAKSSTLFEKVTSSSQIKADNKYIFVYATAPYALSGNGYTENIQLNGNVADIGTSSTTVLTLGGDATNGYTLYYVDGEGTHYLSHSGRSTTYTTTVNTLTIQNTDYNGYYVKDKDDSYYFCYNAGNDPFRWYQSVNGTPAYLYVQAATIEAPEINPATGTYYESQTVTITDPEECTIYFTTDGSDPATSNTRINYTENYSGNGYQAIYTPGTTTTIIAVAVDEEDVFSEPVSVTYTWGVPIVSINPSSCEVTASSVTVTMTGTPSEATIYYTTDGNAPTTSSTQYNGAFTVNLPNVGDEVTVKAIAVYHGLTSEVATATYTRIEKVIEVKKPFFSPIENHVYYGNQQIEILCTTENADIYYVIDSLSGTTPPASVSDPTKLSTHYTVPINMNVGMSYRVKAIAYIGDFASQVAEGWFTIKSTSQWTNTTGADHVLENVAELRTVNLADDETVTFRNPIQVVYMSTMANDPTPGSYTHPAPEYVYVRDNSGYGVIYFGKGATEWAKVTSGCTNSPATIFEMGDWIDGSQIKGTTGTWTDGLIPQVGTGDHTITSWPNASLGNTPIIAEEATCADLLSSTPTNNLCGHYLHLRNTTLSDVKDYKPSNGDYRHSGTITDGTLDPTDPTVLATCTYYDRFWIYSGTVGDNITFTYQSTVYTMSGLGHYDQAWFDQKGADAKFDVFCVGDYYRQIDHPYEVYPLDFLWIYQPVISLASGTYTSEQTVTLTAQQPTWATDPVKIYYKTDDMDDWAEYTSPIIVNSDTHIQAYAQVPTEKFNDIVRSEVVEATYTFEGVEDPIITDHLDDPDPDTYEDRIIEVVTGSESVEVTILTNPETPNATTLYTLNGEIPVEGDDVVTNGSITLPAITETTTITAISYIEVEDGQGGYTKVWSSPVTRTYTFVKSNGVVYDLLTTAPTVGNVYVIVNKDAYMGMSTAQSGNNRASTGVKFTDNTKEHVYGNDELALFVLENANAGRYYFKNINGNGYLTVTTNDYANLSTSATASSYSEAAVAIGDQAAGYPATIRFNYDGTNRYLRYFAKGHTFTTNSDVTLNENVFLYGTTATPLAVIESEFEAASNKQVTVADNLIGAWAVYDVANGHKYLWAKDMGYSIDKTSPVTGQVDYVKDVLGFQHRDWDQSNWVILDFGSIPGLEESELMEFVGKKLTGGTVVGKYVEGKNNGGNYRIVLNEAPTAVEDAEAAKYPGWGEAKPLGGTSQNPNTNPNSDALYTYYYNTYGPTNFLDANLNAPYGNGFVAGDDALGTHKGEKLFFMNPKVQEVARVSAVYAGNDKFTVYVPSVTDNVNGWALKGAFTAKWDYNYNGIEYGVKPNDMENAKDYGVIFHAVVVRKAAGGASGAPRRASADPDADDYMSDRFEVYPLDLTSPSDSNKTAVRDLQAEKTVVSVRYYNVMGMESKQPFEGINIVVTRYSDGSASTVKVLR